MGLQNIFIIKVNMVHFFARTYVLHSTFHQRWKMWRLRTATGAGDSLLSVVLSGNPMRTKDIGFEKYENEAYVGPAMASFV